MQTSATRKPKPKERGKGSPRSNVEIVTYTVSLYRQMYTERLATGGQVLEVLVHGFKPTDRPRVPIMQQAGCFSFDGPKGLSYKQVWSKVMETLPMILWSDRNRFTPKPGWSYLVPTEDPHEITISHVGIEPRVSTAQWLVKAAQALMSDIVRGLTDTWKVQIGDRIRDPKPSSPLEETR